MNKHIKYQYWPKIVKVSTAFTNKRFVIESTVLPMVLGILFFGSGVSHLCRELMKPIPFVLLQNTPMIAAILIGAVNLVGAYSIRWVMTHSSWEERFNNESSIIDKVISGIVCVLLCASLFLMFTYN